MHLKLFLNRLKNKMLNINANDDKKSSYFNVHVHINCIQNITIYYYITRMLFMKSKHDVCTACVK